MKVKASLVLKIQLAKATSHTWDLQRTNREGGREGERERETERERERERPNRSIIACSCHEAESETSKQRGKKSTQRKKNSMHVGNVVPTVLFFNKT